MTLEIAPVLAATIGRIDLSAMGLGRVKTLYGVARNSLCAVAMRWSPGLDYALIAAMSG